MELLPLVSSTYAVEITDGNGCQAADELQIRLIKEREVYFPNVFTPNGDGLNERFYPQAGRDVSSIRYLRIFDRWGALIYEIYNFQPNDPAAGWDGFFKSQLLDPNVFVYMAEVEFIDGYRSVFSGDVALVR
ncbi:MAG: T9SS type B sorting domain-containing protein [Bacteroidota bacterium]